MGGERTWAPARGVVTRRTRVQRVRRLRRLLLLWLSSSLTKTGTEGGGGDKEEGGGYVVVAVPEVIAVLKRKVASAESRADSESRSGGRRAAFVRGEEESCTE